MERRCGAGHDHQGEVRNGLGGARDRRGIAAEDPGTIVVMRTQGEAGLLRVAHPGKRPLRVPPAKLAVVERGSECDALAGMLGDAQTIVHYIGRAWGNGLGIDQGTRRPGVAFIDLVAMLIDQEGAVEVRPRLYWSAAPVGHSTAPEEHLAQVVHGLELDPDVKSINGATGKEMPHTAVAYHHLDEHLCPALHRH